MFAYSILCIILMSAFALLLYRIIRQAAHDFGGFHWFDKTETFASGHTIYTCRICGRCEVIKK